LAPHLIFAAFNAAKMLFGSAILKGLLAPPLVIMVVRPQSDDLCCDRSVARFFYTGL
jgi:hypothetical protein